MPKKRVSHKPDSAHKSAAHGSIEKALIENFVATQKVLVNLSGKIDNLASQISKLLELFEISAKALAEKNFQRHGDDSKKIMDKMDSLLNQNKLIARGLTLLHESNSGSEPMLPAREMPQRPKAPINSRPEMGEGYQKSIVGETVGNFESPLPPERREQRPGRPQR